jgi:hypothetical protein
MPQLPNPDEPGQPGVRGREAETDRPSQTSDQGGVDHTRPAAEDGGGATGRQPQHPGQPGRITGKPGDRDEGAKR